MFGHIPLAIEFAVTMARLRRTAYVVCGLVGGVMVTVCRESEAPEGHTIFERVNG